MHIIIPRAGFLNLGTTDILSQVILGSGAVLCITGCLARSPVCPQKTPGTPLAATTNSTPDTAKCPLGAKMLQLKTTQLEKLGSNSIPGDY